MSPDTPGCGCGWGVPGGFHGDGPELDAQVSGLTHCRAIQTLRFYLVGFVGVLKCFRMQDTRGLQGMQDYMRHHRRKQRENDPVLMLIAFAIALDWSSSPATYLIVQGQRTGKPDPDFYICQAVDSGFKKSSEGDARKSTKKTRRPRLL